MSKTVFICYRRTNQAHAVKMYHLLREAGYDPFIDIKDLGAGAWRILIQREIQKRAHFIVLLTPSAVARFEEPNDTMRFEIETALDSRRNLVPLVFEGFSYSDPRIRAHLTGKLAILSEYNAFPINWRRLKKDIHDLIHRFLSIHPDDVVHPDAPNHVTHRLSEVLASHDDIRDAADKYAATVLAQPPSTSPPQPMPVPIPNGVVTAENMTEERVLRMMYQAIADLQPITDDELAREEAGEHGDS